MPLCKYPHSSNNFPFSLSLIPLELNQSKRCRAGDSSLRTIYVIIMVIGNESTQWVQALSERPLNVSVLSFVIPRSCIAKMATTLTQVGIMALNAYIMQTAELYTSLLDDRLEPLDCLPSVDEKPHRFLIQKLQFFFSSCVHFLYQQGMTYTFITD